ncbi:sulfiredoxin, chloroplastic/mitochondrial isoform X2 [Syzygium oleosum]|nr:sulfiredoxin, chloroplastic/mitochondrial isoform X2 [Syzygium oleosum]
MASFVLQLPTTTTSRWRSFSVSASASSNGAAPGQSQSVGQGKGGPVIVELPLDKIRRPLMRTRANDPVKVKDLMDSIQEIGLQVPIDVLDVDGVYYGFSGCHRYEAHQRLGLPTIRCKVRKATKETLR